MLLFPSIAFAQTATDAKGNKVYNTNSVAIFTRVTKFAVGDTMRVDFKNSNILYHIIICDQKGDDVNEK